MYDFKREFIKLSFTVYRVVFSAAEWEMGYWTFKS